MKDLKIILILNYILIILSVILLSYDYVNMDDYELGFFIILVQDVVIVLYYLFILWILKKFIGKVNNHRFVFISIMVTIQLLPVLYYLNEVGYL